MTAIRIWHAVPIEHSSRCLEGVETCCFLIQQTWWLLCWPSIWFVAFYVFRWPGCLDDLVYISFSGMVPLLPICSVRRFAFYFAMCAVESFLLSAADLAPWAYLTFMPVQSLLAVRGWVTSCGTALYARLTSSHCKSTWHGLFFVRSLPAMYAQVICSGLLGFSLSAIRGRFCSRHDCTYSGFFLLSAVGFAPGMNIPIRGLSAICSSAILRWWFYCPAQLCVTVLCRRLVLCFLRLFFMSALLLWAAHIALGSSAIRRRCILPWGDTGLIGI